MSGGVCRRCTRSRFPLVDGLCCSCRAPARARRRQRERAAARRPQRRQGPGCFVCGGPIPRGRYTCCSQRCSDLWNLATSPASARAQLAALHGARCWECLAWDHETGRVCELDHVRPLWSLSAEERAELRWWLPGNLQLLCPSCHGRKTAREAAERARLRRQRVRAAA